MSVLTTVLKRDRALVLTALSVMTVVAWADMTYEAHAMYKTGVCQCAGMKLSGPDTEPWAATTLIPLFLMWSEMMVAMMIPSAAPMVLLFATVNRKRRENEQPFVPTSVFLLGYIAVWTGFSVVAAVAQWALHGAALLSPLMVSTSPTLAGALLIAAGGFQWTRFKTSCLVHCRSPLSFVMSEWREGTWGAFVMGLKHGSYCTGCCWFLMALLFVAGVMNIWWIAIISVLVLLEKTVPRGLIVGRFAGAVLALWGVWLLGWAYLA